MKTMAIATALMFVAGLAQAQVPADGRSVAATGADRGATVFAETCSACHLESMSAEKTETADSLRAPPMNLLTTIIRKKTGNSEAAFIAHVTDFTVQPAREKVKALLEAVDRFGLMPPIADTTPSVTSDDLRAVARWLYSRYDYQVEIKQLEEHERDEAEHTNRQAPDVRVAAPAGQER